MRSNKHICSQRPAVGWQLHVWSFNCALCLLLISARCPIPIIPVAMWHFLPTWKGHLCRCPHGSQMLYNKEAILTPGVRWQQRLGRLEWLGQPFTYVRHAKRFDVNVQLEFHSAQLLHATLHEGLLHVILPRYLLDDAAANSWEANVAVAMSLNSFGRPLACTVTFHLVQVDLKWFIICSFGANPSQHVIAARCCKCVS
jgi:hypothetical protein